MGPQVGQPFMPQLGEVWRPPFNMCVPPLIVMTVLVEPQFPHLPGGRDKGCTGGGIRSLSRPLPRAQDGSCAPSQFIQQVCACLCPAEAGGGQRRPVPSLSLLVPPCNSEHPAAE